MASSKLAVKPRDEGMDVVITLGNHLKGDREGQVSLGARVEIKRLKVGRTH